MLLFIRSHRILSLVIAICFFFIFYYNLGYFFMYNNNSYTKSNVYIISSPVSGQIETIYATNHTCVKNGDSLFKIDTSAIELKLDQEKNRLAILKTKAQQISSDINELKITNHEIDIQKSIIKQLNNEILASTVISHTNGKINNLHLYEGQHVFQGERLFGIIQENSIKVISNIKETNMQMIKPGKKVWIYFPSIHWRLFSGTVEYISPAISREPSSRSDAAASYVKPSTGWVRYPYRVPVTVSIDNIKDKKIASLTSGTDALVIAFPF